MKSKKTTYGNRLAADVMQYKNEIKEWSKSKELNQRLAYRLYKCADAHALTPRDVAAFPHLLDRFELDPCDVNETIIAGANRLDRMHGGLIEEAVIKINRMCCLIDYQTAYNASGCATQQEYNDLIAPRIKHVAEATVAVATQEKSESGRFTIYGHAPTAILRWMGAEKWSIDDSARVIRKLGAAVADATVTIQVKRGRGNEPKLPALTEQQANDIYEMF
jgi:hypothetical protein